MTKHLGAEVIHRHYDTLNMRWIESRAETAPTLELVESYVQNWVEDAECIDEHGQVENESINAVESDPSGKGRRVHFGETISVKPIQATGKDKPTPPRGKSAVSAVWQSTDVSIDFVGI